jgi:hypothetical protein
MFSEYTPRKFFALGFGIFFLKILVFAVAMYAFNRNGAHFVQTMTWFAYALPPVPLLFMGCLAYRERHNERPAQRKAVFSLFGGAALGILLSCAGVLLLCHLA